MVSGLLVEQAGAQAYPAPGAPLLAGCRRLSSRHTPFHQGPVYKTSSRRTTVRRLRPAARAVSRQGTRAAVPDSDQSIGWQPGCGLQPFPEPIPTAVNVQLQRLHSEGQLLRCSVMFMLSGSQLQLFGATSQDQFRCNRHLAFQKISFSSDLHGDLSWQSLTHTCR